MRPRPLTRRIATLLLALACAGPAVAQQRMVSIPEAAKRAAMTFQASPEVVIDGRTGARLAPGVRIFDRNNYLTMYGSLAGTFVVRYTIEPLSGLVQNVWILTDEEIARPDPKPTQ